MNKKKIRKKQNQIDKYMDIMIYLAFVWKQNKCNDNFISR